MMRQMRENTKWIMLITALAFVGLMVFQWGMDLSGRSTSAQTGGDAGSVNGERITYQEYQTAYRNLYQQQQQQLAGQEITPAMNRQIEDAAWNQLVTNKLLEQELDRRDIRVTDAEILQAAQYAPPPDLQSNPIFQTNGQFDLNKYQQFISSGLDEQTLGQLESYYREVIPRSKLYFRSTAGITVSEGQLWRMYRDANETAEVRYVAIDPNLVVPEAKVQVPDAEVSSFYEAHKDDFKRPAKATVKYVVLDRSPSAADTGASRQQAVDLRGRWAAGETSAALIRETGVDTMPPAARRELVVTRGNNQLPPALEQAAFAAPVGQLGEPILTPLGFHVLKVTRREGETASVEQVVVPIRLETSRENALLARVDSMETLAEDNSLDAIARTLALQVQSAELNPPLTFIPGVGTADDGVYWALQEGKRGEVSPVYEQGNAYYMFQLVSKTDEGTLTLAEATPTIRGSLLKKRQLEEAKAALKDAPAKGLDAIAAQYRTPVADAGPYTRGDFVPGLGRFNAAIGAAFGMAPGQVSPVVEGDGRLVVLQLVKKTEADREAWKKQYLEQRQRVVQALGDEKWQQYLASLKDSAKIVDNRRKIEQAAAAAQQQGQ